MIASPYPVPVRRSDDTVQLPCILRVRHANEESECISINTSRNVEYAGTADPEIFRSVIMR